MKKAIRIITPLGELLVAEDGHGISDIRFYGQESLPSGLLWERTPLLDRAQTQLTQYFAGTRREFDLPLSLKGTDFQKDDWAALCTIPYGETRSYGQIAEQIGRPRAFRAVGMANHHNPVSIVVPCHRVIGADGSLVGYGGGLDKKIGLLALELENVVNEAVGQGEFDEVRSFAFADIPFSPRVREQCLRCPSYGKKHSCPPACGSLEGLQRELSKYPKGLMFSRVYRFEKTFDHKGYQAASVDFTKRTNELRRRLGNTRSVVLASGGCKVCPVCTYEEGAPCRHPEAMVRSMSAVGTDVVSLTKKLGMKYNNGEKSVTYFGMVLYQ